MEKKLAERIKKVREDAVYIAGSHHIGRKKALKYADECEEQYLDGRKKIMDLIKWNNK